MPAYVTYFVTVCSTPPSVAVVVPFPLLLSFKFNTTSYLFALQFAVAVSLPAPNVYVYTFTPLSTVVAIVPFAPSCNVQPVNVYPTLVIAANLYKLLYVCVTLSASYVPPFALIVNVYSLI